MENVPIDYTKQKENFPGLKTSLRRQSQEDLKEY